MIRWLVSFLLGMLWDEIRAQWREFAEPWEAFEDEIRWQARMGYQ